MDGLSNPEDGGNHRPAAGTSDGVAVIMAIGVELIPATVANSPRRSMYSSPWQPLQRSASWRWGKVQDPRGRCPYPAVGAPAVTVDAVHGRLAQAEPLAAVVQVVLVFVAGDTVSVVFGGWLWLLGAGRTDQGEGQDQQMVSIIQHLTYLRDIADLQSGESSRAAPIVVQATLL